MDTQTDTSKAIALVLPTKHSPDDAAAKPDARIVKVLVADDLGDEANHVLNRRAQVLNGSCGENHT